MTGSSTLAVTTSALPLIVIGESREAKSGRRASMYASARLDESCSAENRRSKSIHLVDQAGTLGRFATRSGQLEANIVQAHHHSLFLGIGAKAIAVSMTIEVRDRTHANRIFSTLEHEGYHPRAVK